MTQVVRWPYELVVGINTLLSNSNLNKLDSRRLRSCSQADAPLMQRATYCSILTVILLSSGIGTWCFGAYCRVTAMSWGANKEDQSLEPHTLSISAYHAVSKEMLNFMPVLVI